MDNNYNVKLILITFCGQVLKNGLINCIWKNKDKYICKVWQKKKKLFSKWIKEIVQLEFRYGSLKQLERS